MSAPSAEEFNALKARLDAYERGHTEGEQTTVGSYLLARLDQLGVRQIFGVPGDFNLGFLDTVEDHPNLSWVGNCNELNAAYAADGYARIKEGSLGVLITTFGVGELSAMNGIAGSFSEMVPILHIVGVPSTTQQKARPMLHHTLGDGRFDVYARAAEQVTCAQASILSTSNAASEIDRVLHEVIVKARPGYLMLPTDMAFAKISGSRLETPIPRSPPANDPEVEEEVLNTLVKLIEQAQNKAVVLVDACVVRHEAREETAEFVKKTGLKVFEAPLGKGSVDASYPNYGGLYVGSLSHPDIKAEVEGAPLVISLGGLKSDFNTGNFTYKIANDHTVELHSDHTKIKNAIYPGIGMKELLSKLTARLPSATLQEIPHKTTLPSPGDDSNKIITHKWMWPRIGSFLREKDVVVAETGTSSYGILEVPFPPGVKFISQILYGSIGFSLGALCGAAFAAEELKLGRPILFIGDGSLQLTVQELSTMIIHGLKPIVFVLNNNGYTIERYLHGWERKYNNIAPWKFTSLLNVLGDADGSKTKSYTVSTKQEMDELLNNVEFAKADKMQLVEVVLDRFDAPVGLHGQAALSKAANKYVS